MFSKRRIHKTCLYIFLIIITFIGTTFVRNQRSYDINFNEMNSIHEIRELRSTRKTFQDKKVTKSISEIFATFPELSDHVVFFNRVPKSGSEMLVLLMQWMQGVNGFKHIRLPGSNIRRLSRHQQEKLVEKVTDALHDETIPLTFDRHVYFVNFTSFGRQSPTFLNLVRDPIDKATSRFYYSRVTPNPLNPDLHGIPLLRKKFLDRTKSFEQCVKSEDPECSFETGKSYDLTIPYFCGHEEWCMSLNNHKALQRAKANVDRYFPVVGILEELNATLVVLEKKLPYFFKGVQDMYFTQLLEPHKNRNRQRPRKLNELIKKQLETRLELEYEFYYWLHNRLLKQFNALL
uniref:Sulfotransferase domain-containing protein n=1 Tax=Clastoptera arizonana TaxID=38151 RepID=A0A1B6DBH8_9HEMI